MDYLLTDDITGKKYNLSWDKSIPPTKEDIDGIFATLPERKVEPTPEIGAGMPSVEQPSRFTRWLAETKIPERIQAGLFGLQKAIPFSVPLAKKIYGEEPVEKVEKVAEEHPVAGMVGGAGGMLAGLGAMGIATQPLGVALGKALISKGAPTVARFLAPATQTALTFSTYEAIRGVSEGKSGEDIAKQSAKSFAIGGGLGLGGGIVNIVGRIASAGAMGPVATLIEQGKIRKEDLPAVGLNSAIFMLFTVANAPSVSKALKQQAKTNLFKSSVNFVKAKNPTLDQATINREANIFTQLVSNLSQKAEVRNLEQFTSAIQKALPSVSPRAQIPYGDIYSPAIRDAVANIYNNIQANVNASVPPPIVKAPTGIPTKEVPIFETGQDIMATKDMPKIGIKKGEIFKVLEVESDTKDIHLGQEPTPDWGWFLP